MSNSSTHTATESRRFADFFAAIQGHQPYPYQVRLALEPWPQTRIIPTGFGKTAAVLAAFLWKIKTEPTQPKRLVYCLPMRTLVEQTAEAARQWIAGARHGLDIAVGLDVLMGGLDDAEPASEGSGRRRRRDLPGWVMHPDRPAILIGTQDMLISAALMRGYGLSRYRWPVAFSLLHNDALWVFDEVQLTGATLATSCQLEAFRAGFQTARPARSLWMSATLDPAWLRTVDFQSEEPVRPHDLEDVDLARTDGLWRAVKRLAPLHLPATDNGTAASLKAYAGGLAEAVLGLAAPMATTLVFLNTVPRAQAVYRALRKAAPEAELLLVHSRFRAEDRRRLTDALGPGTQEGKARIIVATQAMEAGIDITSAVLITELAPWAALVQRFGRCNRKGECGARGAEVHWIDLPDDDKAARPYSAAELADARAKLRGLSACGPADLAAIPLPTAPVGQVIRRRDFLELFDTDPDLSGFDVDIAPYVRDSEDTDLTLFWRPAPEDQAPPADAPAPRRAELCPVPIGRCRTFLGKKAGGRAAVRAWRWDGLNKIWALVRAEDLFPGLTLWVDAAAGGYAADVGFDPDSADPVPPVDLGPSDPPAEAVEDERDARLDGRLVTLRDHSLHVRAEVAGLADGLCLSDEDRDLLTVAAHWHDLGKAHAAFVARTHPLGSPPPDPVLAKWPKETAAESTSIAVATPVAAEGAAGPAADPPQRRAFRHELASALAFLARHDWRADASLAAYLIAAHHGKIRMRLRALPTELPPAQSDRPDPLFARGVVEGDRLPQVDLGDGLIVPETGLQLDLMRLGDSPLCGPSWATRTQRLLATLGPFRLAWLETLLRVADWRASQKEEEGAYDDVTP